MPEPIVQDDAEGRKYCARCNMSDATIVVRSEHLCRKCFMKYVGAKMIKRLEMNKIRGGFHEIKKTLLVPINFDLSSICLLHALDLQLQQRIENGRHASYTLHVLCIDESCVRKDSNVEKLLPLLKQRFPDCTCSVLLLEDYFKYGIDLEPLISKQSGESAGENLSNLSHLQRLILSLPSATSRADVIEILRRRVTAAFAKQTGCDSILYGDSTTKLAERTLCETAKGRGGALPWLTSDNFTMDGVPCSYPLRDLLQKELGLYVDHIFPSLLPLIMPRDSKLDTVSSKEMTIDQLMSQYFESVEEKFPSIVANVVRTSGKLAPRLDIGHGRACNLCKLPINNMEWGGEQENPTAINHDDPKELAVPQELCAGCVRVVQKT